MRYISYIVPLGASSGNPICYLSGHQISFVAPPCQACSNPHLGWESGWLQFSSLRMIHLWSTKSWVCRTPVPILTEILSFSGNCHVFVERGFHHPLIWGQSKRPHHRLYLEKVHHPWSFFLWKHTPTICSSMYHAIYIHTLCKRLHSYGSHAPWK
jgi:hypothetical protein